MAGQRIIQCIGPSYQLADRKAAVQRAVNLYMSEIEGLGEDKQVVLDSAPGLTLFLNLGMEVRGSYNADGRWFVAANSTLYEIVSGAQVSRGTLNSSSGYVSMKHGTNQLVCVDGQDGYVLNLTTNLLAQIVSDGWRGSVWVEHLDGYFVFVAPETEQFYISAIDDGTSLDALDFSSADSQPDNIVTHRVSKRELYLLGTRSVEVWINNGGADFPLTRYNTTPIDVGVVGYRAAVIAAEALVWVGQTDRGAGYVYALNGYQPIRISTQAVEQALRSCTDLSLCTMWTYQTEGAEFVAVNGPGMETTWVWDASTRQWHERAELVSGNYTPLRTDQVTFAQGNHYATSGTSIYLIDPEAFSLAGDPLVRERTWPHFMLPSMEPVSYRCLELACTTGGGGNITLEVSNDGGYTFGAPLLRSLGAIGRWMQRVRWQMLGTSRDRVFRLRCTDAVRLTIHGAAVDAG